MGEKIKYVTGKVILLYPRVTKLYEWKGKMKYSISILIPKNSNEGEKLKNIISQMWRDNKLKRTDHNPLRDGDIYAEDQSIIGKNADYAKGNYILKASSQFDIRVLDAKKQPYTGEDNDIIGHYGRVSMSLDVYNNDGSGVTCYLHGVQVLGKADIELPRGGSNCDDDFDFEEIEITVENENEVPF